MVNELLFLQSQAQAYDLFYCQESEVWITLLCLGKSRYTDSFSFSLPQKKHFSLINAPARDDEADFDDGEEEDDSR